MNFDELIIEQTEVTIDQSEYNRRQIRLIAALLAIAESLYQKEQILLGESKNCREEFDYQEAA